MTDEELVKYLRAVEWFTEDQYDYYHSSWVPHTAADAIERLTRERDEFKDDSLRLHKVATDRLDEVIALKRERDEARAGFDLVAHLHRQREFSRSTFGPGPRTQGVLDHIRKELAEIEADPADITEWVDVIILAFDGAWRAGWEPEAIVEAIVAKQTKNEARKWPDWRTADPNKAIEHDRSGEGRALATPTPDTEHGR